MTTAQKDKLLPTEAKVLRQIEREFGLGAMLKREQRLEDLKKRRANLPSSKFHDWDRYTKLQPIDVVYALLMMKKYAPELLKYLAE